MDWIAIGTAVAALALVYTMLRNLRADIKADMTEIKSDLKEVKKDIGEMKVQIGKLETRVDERTLRVKYLRTGTNQEEE